MIARQRGVTSTMTRSLGETAIGSGLASGTSVHQQNWHAGLQSPRAVMRLRTWGGVTKCTDLESTTCKVKNESAPDSFESWDARRTVLPRSLLTSSLRSESQCKEWL